MKIVVITNYWKKGPGGGVTTYLVNLVDEFQNKNLNVNVIFREGSDSKNHYVTGNRTIFALKSYLLLNKIKPDTIYSQGTWYCLLPSYIYKKTHSINLIHTFHTEPVENEKLFLLGKVFFQHLLNECDYVTFASKRLKQKIMDIWGLRFRNTEITYAGVHIPQKIPDYEIKKFREEFRIKENSIVLLAIGLTALKYKAEGAKLLIKAVKKLKSKYPNILLLITREESFSNELKEFALFEGVSENIIFTGDIDDPNVPLQICDIYTHTPLGEGGVSLAVLEAMAIGKPIIATSVGGIPEIIEDGINGLIVQPEVDQIAQKIDYLLENKDLAAKLGENAQNKVKSKFNWRISADKFLSLSN